MPPPLPPPQTFSALISAFTSFLTVAIHTILHQRALYPLTSFLTARAYNYPVHQNRHPAVCTWVTDAVAAVEAELLRSRVARVALVIYSPACRPLERFVWDVSRFPVGIAREEHGTTFEREAEEDLVDLEEQFRAALARLTACGTALGPLPLGCTFTVAVELREEAGAPVGHPQPWIPAEPALQATRRKKDGRDGHEQTRGEGLGRAKTTPVRAVRAGEMMFELWIEEGKAKLELDASMLDAGSTDFR